MKDKDKTQKQLITELSKLRRRIAELEGCERQRKEIEETLTRWNQQKTAILDSMSELVAYQDTRMRILWANRAASESVGVDPQQLVGRHCYEIWQQRHRPCVGCPVIKARKSGHPHEAEITTSDGRMWLIRGYPVRNTKDNVTGAVEVTLEITDRKQAEEKIEHLNLALHAIRNVNQLITREKDRDKLLKGTCKNLVENRGYHSTWIALLDEAGGLVTTAEAGFDKSFTPLIEQLKRSVMTRCGHKALSQAGVVVTENPFSNCTDCPLSDKYHDRSAMTVRLEYGGKVRGLLSASIPVYLAADEEEQALFREVAEDISFALHNIEVEKDRGRAEEALRESEERYKTLFDEAVVGISLADAETGIIINCNQALAALVGRKRAELIGKPQNILHTPSGDDKKVFSPTFKRHLTDKEGQILETQVITKTGDIKEVEIKANILDIQGRKVLQGFFRDITERKRAEEGLRESETRFRTLFEGIPDSVLVHDDEGTILHINEVGAQQLEWIPKDLVGRNLREIVTPENATSIADHVKEVHKVGWCRFETTYVSRSGWQIAAEVNEHPIKFGKKKAILSVARDITERRRTEEELRENEERFRRVVETMKVGLGTIDENGVLTYVNEYFAKMLGYSIDEMIGRSTLDFFEEKSRKIQEELFKKRRAGMRDPTPYEATWRRKDGEKVYSIVSPTPNFDAGGRYTGSYGIHTDITERKRMEQELRKSEEKYKELINGMHDTAWVIDFDGNFIDVNDAAVEVLGYSREELLAMGPHDIDSSLDAETITGLIKKMSTDKIQVFETSHSTKDGKQIPVEINSSLVTYHGKRAILGIARDVTERKEAEKALLREKIFSDVVINSSPGLFFVISDKGNAIRWNKKAEMVTGYSASEISKMNILAFVSKDDEKTAAEAIQEAFTNGQASIEINVLAKSGKKIPFYITGRRAKIDNSTYIVCTGMDITDRKQAEKELRESEERFRTFADEVSFEGLIIHDKGKILGVNRQFAKMHGYKISELFEIDAFAPVAPESRDLILKHIQEGYEKPYEAVALRKDGSTFPIEIRAKKIPYHGKMVRATAIRDITERRQAEKKLRESEEKYRDLVETINDWIWEVDQNGLLTYISPRISDLLGYEPEEWLGKTPFDFMPPEETRRVRGLFDQLVANRQPVVNLENTVLHKDGRSVVFETSATPFFDPGGEFKGYRGVDRDITDRKKAEEQLQESYKQLQKTFITTVKALASTVEMKDQYTAGHQPRVTLLASAIAEEMGLSQEQIEGIRMSGLIHDIGKIIVPAEILNKPGPLTDIQYEMVKMHPRAGFDILKGIKFPWPVAQIIFQHHELMDGSGYPQGLTGDQIMLEARVLTVANVVEAMTSHRPYRAAHDITAALDEIKKHKGVLYDPDVVDACLRLFNEKGFTFDSLSEPTTPPVAS
jgi:PAS domain S-box-containing protein/putative nucleotidyltransferase with HDIG domain